MKYKVEWIENPWEPKEPHYLEIILDNGRRLDLGKIMLNPGTRTYWYLSGHKVDIDTREPDLAAAKVTALKAASYTFQLLSQCLGEAYELSKTAPTPENSRR